MAEGTVAGLFGLLKGLIDNPLSNTAGGAARAIGDVGQYMGLDPKLANELDMGREVQLFVEGKATRTDVEKTAVKDFVDAVVVKDLEANKKDANGNEIPNSGMNPVLASLLGAVASHAAEWVATPVVNIADNVIGDAVSGIAGKITGGQNVTSPGSGLGGGKPSALSIA